jgi:hypothetical protein
LGRAHRIVITKDDTPIFDGAGDAKQTKGRINQIKAELETPGSVFDARNSRSSWPSLLAAWSSIGWAL